jgi:hypothetical protein
MRTRLRGCALLVTAFLALQGGAQAQAPAPPPARTPAAIRYGKFAAFGLAAGFTALGAVHHHRADAYYSDVLALCRDHGPCPIGPDGRYTNAAAEALYQRVVRGDRSARFWLIGGQAALVGGAALFVMELKRKKGPENIPFSPYIVAGAFGTRVGVRISWRDR